MQKAGGYKSLQIIFYALLAGQIMFLVISFLLVKQQLFISKGHELENILLPLVSILALAGIIAGRKIFKTRIQNLDETNPLAENFSAYRAASIIRWALMEGPCLFAIISFMITGNQLFILIAIVILVCFGTASPVKVKWLQILE